MIKLDSPEHEDDVHFLRWAVSLHEIGLSVAHSEFHKHGAYILGHADMPGFSKRDQARLALLVLGQRGKLQKLASMPAGDDPTGAWCSVSAWRSCFIVRGTTMHYPNCRSGSHQSGSSLMFLWAGRMPIR
jgi:exopolyphosphatase/guanosine-5'-triphosphate,3'-diphosphate pyrophosphatase